MLWVLAKVIPFGAGFSARRPDKELQASLTRGLWFWWVNAATVIIPSAVLVIALLVLVGLLPATDVGSASPVP